MKPGKIILFGSFIAMVAAVNIAASKNVDLSKQNSDKPSISTIWRTAFLHMFIPGYTMAKASYDTTVALKEGNIQ